MKLPWVIVPLWFLNATFVWTSHVILFLPSFYGLFFWWPYEDIVILSAQGLGLSPYLLMDSLALLWLVLTLLGLRFLGWRRDALIVSIDVLAFECCIAVFDPGELFLHLTASQAVLHFMAWFTNFDMMLGALGASVCLGLPELAKRGRALSGHAQP